ncbi:MAG: glycosyltransferase [Chromatiales bacterium]
MSVVLATPGSSETIAATIYHLRRQSVADRLELVIVARSAEALALDEKVVSGFWGYQVVSVGPFLSIGHANAAGVRAARSEVVALAEDHCFPDPGWAAALIERHTRDEVAAVGPVIRNANPGTLVSWCDFVIGYGPWIEPAPDGEQPFLPGHNSSYKKTALMEFGAQLDDLLEAETVLHVKMRERGYRLVIEPRAKTAHVNFAKLSSWLPVQFHCGRVFAANRAQDWGWAKRALYVVASPLIPGIRLARSIRHMRRPQQSHPSLLRLTLLLGIGLAADGLGQLVGYLAGAGSSLRKLARFEFRRIDHVPQDERRLWKHPAGHTVDGQHAGKRPM